MATLVSTQMPAHLSEDLIMWLAANVHPRDPVCSAMKTFHKHLCACNLIRSLIKGGLYIDPPD